MQAGLQSLISDSCPCLQNALDKKKKKKSCCFVCSCFILLSVLCAASCAVVSTCYSVCLSPEEYASAAVLPLDIC